MKLLYSILGGLLALAPAACERGGEKEQKAPAEPAAAAAPQPAAPEAKKSFGSLTIDEVAARIGKPGVFLIDNNPRDVFDKGHVPTATWVDHKSITASDLPADKNATLIFYCANEH